MQQLALVSILFILLVVFLSVLIEQQRRGNPHAFEDAIEGALLVLSFILWTAAAVYLWVKLFLIFF